MAHENEQIKVQVHYIAAGQPFEMTVLPAVTVGAVKAEALNRFGLEETGQKIYKVFSKKNELQTSQTIGEVAGDKHELKLDLEEFITQG